MHAAVRPYVTAGIALVGASVIAVTPVTPSLPGLPVEQAATRLLADSSILNIPVNLLIAAANIPYYESLALQEYAYALGPAGQPGGVPGWVPLSATAENGGLVPGPKPGTEDDLYAVGGTGSWWKESLNGNTWGWDDGNWPQMAAIAHAILPFAFTLPIVQQLEVFAEAEFIAGANVNCEFNCADVLGYLGRWLVFSTPLTDLLSGTPYPNTVNGYDPNNPPDYVHQPFWADASTTPDAQLEPLKALQAVADYFMQDPSGNPVMLPNFGDVLTNAVKLGVDFYNDYNPLVTGSFLYWGAPTLWSVPALLAGLVQNFTGIPNQFIETPQWQGIVDVASGGQYPGAENAGPLSLLTGVPAGIEHLVLGLLGYLDPNTYLGISLGNTLLRTYADGSLPGSDIARFLEGFGVRTLLDAVGSPLNTTSTGSLTPSISSLSSTLQGTNPNGSLRGSDIASLLPSDNNDGTRSVLLSSPLNTTSNGPSTTSISSPVNIMQDGSTSLTLPPTISQDIVDGQSAISQPVTQPVQNLTPATRNQVSAPPAADLKPIRPAPVLNNVTSPFDISSGGAPNGANNANKTPLKDAVSDTRQQVQNTVGSVNTGIKNAVDGIKSALSGGSNASETSSTGSK